MSELESFLPLSPISLDEWVCTKSGNKVSKKAFLFGSQNVEIKSHSLIQPRVMLRGDLALIRLGKFVSLGQNTIVRPSAKVTHRFYTSLRIGDYVSVGEGCVLAGSSIGDFVVIEDHVTIGNRAVIKSGVKILGKPWK